MRYAVTLLLLLNLIAVTQAAEDFIWIEAETPTSLQGLKELNAWGHDYISGKWANISVDADKLDTIDGDAILLKYDFDSPAGTFELWNRIGFEYGRSPFDWRIDGGDWKTASPDDLTIDLMEIGFWCEIAWLKLGNVPLQQGKHTLEIRIAKRTKPDGKPDRILYASDCFCLHAGQFKPYSKYKPNEDHQTAKDHRAAMPYVFLPKDALYENPTPSPTLTLNLAQTSWEICRDDEYLPEPVTEPISKLPETTRWSAIEVPGDKNELRPDLMFAHRVWYRKKIEIPAEFQNYSVYIEFPQNSLNTTVYVNGQLCGFNKIRLCLSALTFPEPSSRGKSMKFTSVSAMLGMLSRKRLMIR
jgi:beta-galactosidase